MKWLIYFFLAMLLFVYGIVIFMHGSGRVLPRDVKRVRIERLKELRDAVEINMRTSLDYQDGLQDIYNNIKTRHLLISPTDTDKLLKYTETADFNDVSDYAFYHNNDKWFIIELYTDVIYPYRMMIDEAGNVGEIRENKEKEK